MEPAAASLPTLDALLAHDGKDVGTALPTEVWASTSQGTLRCWSEGAKLRLEKATDATAAPAGASSKRSPHAPSPESPDLRQPSR